MFVNMEVPTADQPVTETDPVRGSVTVVNPLSGHSGRVGIVDIAFLNSLQNILDYENQHDAGRIFGKIWGSTFFEKMQEQTDREVAATPKDDFIEQLNQFFSYAGIGQFRITEANPYYLVELKHPLKPGDIFLAELIGGFISSLLSALAEEPLGCELLSTDNNDSFRYALGREEHLSELSEQLAAGKSEEEIHNMYGNKHLR